MTSIPRDPYGVRPGDTTVVRNAAKTTAAPWWVQLLLALFIAPVADAQSGGATTYGEEAKTRLQLAERVAPLSEDSAFGEQIGQFNGSLSFRYVDASLPGNDALKVEFARILGNDYSPNFWGWDVDIPKITSVMPRNWTAGWTPDPPESAYNDRNVEFRRQDYWNGFRMRVDGQSAPLLYRTAQAGQLPTDPRTPVGPSPGGQWRFMTKAGWLLRTIPAQGRPGSSVVGLAPNGVTYTFDHLVKDQYDTVVHPTKMMVTTVSGPGYSVSTAEPEQLGRDIYVLYVSRVEDRFGNVVNFDWVGPKLERIRASDGRIIELESRKVIPEVSDEIDPRYYVDSISVGKRTWRYAHVGGQATVTNPDGSTWTHTGGFGPIGYLRTRYETVGTQIIQVPNLEDIGYCTKAYPFAPNQDRTIAVTAPSGARAEYLLRPMRHGRANTPLGCVQQNDNPNSWTTRFPRYVDEWTLQRKTVSGPGIATVVSNYDYAGLDLTFDASASLYVPPEELWREKLHGRKTITVTRSDGDVRTYQFGRNYEDNEGLLLSEEIHGPPTGDNDAPARGGALQLFRRTEYTHVARSDNASQGFSLSWGSSGVGFSDNFANLHIPVRSTTVIQDGVRFTSEVQSFDRYVSPTSVRKQSRNESGAAAYPGYSKVETYANYNDESVWVIRQPGTHSVAGIEVSRVVYNPQTALPQYVYRFNQAQPGQTIAYTPQGHVDTVTDARGKVTTFTNWKRGVPGNIRFDDATTLSAVIDDNGWVTRMDDQLGHATCYEHDAMGRVERIRRPGDTACAGVSTPQPVWAPTEIRFAPSTGPAWGLPDGHWVRTERRGLGSARGASVYMKETRYDAFWRPVMEREWDGGNEAQTQRYRAWRYDSAGRQSFVADPRASALDIDSFGNAGVHTLFDSLGRPVRTHRPSELGVDLESIHTYLPALRTRTRNPRGFETTTQYQAYDMPDTSSPVRIESPEGATTVIVRDVFGKPTSITRSGTHGQQLLSVARSYVYDAQQRLCKRIEPETGSTVMDYDAAGNLAWSASGLALPALACNRDLVSQSLKVQRTYDDLNRLRQLTFSNGLGDQTWWYTADGLPDNVSTRNAGGAIVVNNYTYNNLRLPTTETVSQSDGMLWSLGYGYSPLGHLSSHTHASGQVGYAPNALGQATQAGNYATLARYHPNGSLSTFTYGNGLVHQMVPNSRGLPETSRTALGGVVILDDTYDFDENGNVAAISDARAGHRGDRTMVYDGLDRLERTTSPMFGVAAYTYDVLDNLRRVAVSEGTRVRDNTYAYDARQRLTSVTNTASGAAVLALAYDAQGNLSTRGGQTYSFDYGNRLREVPGVEQYRYDAHGRRIRAVSPGQGAIHSMYGSDGVLRFQHDERANKATDFIYLAGSMVARVSQPLVALPTAPLLTAPESSVTGIYDVSWSTSANATAYRLEERFNAGTWGEIYAGGNTVLPISGRVPGSYQYRVRACSNSNVSSCGNVSETRTVNVQVLPAPNLTVQYTGPRNYTLNWNSISGATTYRLEERVGSGAWGEIYVGPNLALPIANKPNGSYSYRVRACATSANTTCGAVSSTLGVSINVTPPTPTLSAPPSSGTGSYRVWWTPSSGAAVYRLEQQANAGAWSEIQFSDELELQVTGRPNGLYGYRVRACVTGDLATCSSFSEVVVVSVSLLPIAPTLSAPATSDSGSYPVSWTAPTGASYYRLDERQNGGSWQPLYAGSGNSVPISGRNNGSYEYRVRACRSTLEVECSAHSTTRTVVVTLIVLPPAPAISAPANNTTGSYPVSWNSVTGASVYRLEERINGASWNEIQNSGDITRNITGKGNGTYAYRVRACLSAQVAHCGNFSNEASVVVTIPIAPPVPTISGPASSSPDFTFVISWTASSGASYYELERNRNETGWQATYTGAMLFQELQYGVGGSLGFRVRACNSQICSAFSSVHYVLVDGGPVLPYPPVLSAPATSSTGSYTVEWSASPNATHYRLEERANGGSWSQIHYGTERSFAVSGRPSATYDYRIRACLGGCGGYSENVTVVVNLQPVPQPPGGLSAPATSTGSYTVSWNASSGATSYRLEEQVNAGAWSVIQTHPALSATFNARPAGTYRYRVSACNSSTCGAFAGPVTVVVSSGPVIPDAPVLSVPANSPGGSFDVTWTTPAGATRYRLEESVNGGAWSEIQNTVASTVSISRASGSYSYRVRACSGTSVSDCGNASNVGTVTVPAAQIPPNAPTLSGPTTTTADFEFTLTWTGVQHATRYELEQSRNNGSWVEVYDGADLSWTEQRSPATFAYRVRACSSGGCSAFSATHTLVVTPGN
jgi:YD repeat-containing protein